MTEKKMRKMMGAIYYHYDRLQDALNRAHRADLIQYVNYQEEAPCSALWDVKKRLELATRNQIADIVIGEIKQSIWK